MEEDQKTFRNKVAEPDQDLIPSSAPKYILRGHRDAIHAVQLFGQNLRLASADADGWVVIWDMVTKRPIVSWKAHQSAILEVKAFQTGSVTEVYTHGKDHKLCLWRWSTEDEPSLNKNLPLDVGRESRAGGVPELVHSLPVNALNFCAFSLLFLQEFPGLCSDLQNPQNGPTNAESASSKQGEKEEEESKARTEESATNHTPRDETSPSSPAPEPGKPSLIALPNTLNSGGIDIYHLPSTRRVSTIPAEKTIQTGMVMAVSIFTTSSPSDDLLYVASAYEDGHVMLFICRSRTTPSWTWEKIYTHKSHKYPALSLSVSPSKTYFLSSAADSVIVKHPIPAPGPGPGPGPAPSPPSTAAADPNSNSPLAIEKTGHIGQQSLHIRSDGLVFATACWNHAVRVYRCETLGLMTILGWHKEGCNAVAFAEVDHGAGNAGRAQQGLARTLVAVHKQRELSIQSTHWLVVGSKRGQISLWDLY